MRFILPGLPAIFFLSFSFVSPCRGEFPADTSLKVQIRELQSPSTLPNLLQHQIAQHLNRWLSEKGIEVVDKAAHILWCDVYAFEGPDSDNVVLSVGFGRALPARVIELGKKAEILYTGLSARQKAALPKKGKWVRESLSEDFLYEYMMPIDHKLVIVEKSLLFEKLDDIVEQLYQRHFTQ